MSDYNLDEIEVGDTLEIVGGKHPFFSVTIGKEYEVTDIDSGDRLKRKVDLKTANELKDNAFSIATKIDSLVESD